MTSPSPAPSPVTAEPDLLRLGDGTRVDVLEGDPSHEELAALVVALDEAVTTEGARHRPAPRSRWRRAARAEAVGGGPVASRGDLDPVT